MDKIKNILISKKLSGKITFGIGPKIFDHITNIEYNSILDLEKEFNCTLTLLSIENMPEDQFMLEQPDQTKKQ